MVNYLSGFNTQLNKHIYNNKNNKFNKFNRYKNEPLNVKYLKYNVYIPSLTTIKE